MITQTITLSEQCVICILLYILFFLYCELLIVYFIYGVFVLYPRPTVHFTCTFVVFSNPASWLPHWNKRLSCLVFNTQFAESISSVAGSLAELIVELVKAVCLCVCTCVNQLVVQLIIAARRNLSSRRLRIVFCYIWCAISFTYLLTY